MAAIELSLLKGSNVGYLLSWYGISWLMLFLLDRLVGIVLSFSNRSRERSTRPIVLAAPLNVFFQM